MIVLRLIYSIWFYLVFMVFLLFGLLWYALASLAKPKKRPGLMIGYNRFWAHCLELFVGMRFNVKGRTKIEKNKRYVIVSNHRSYADSFILCYGIRSPFKPLAKSELVKIPLMGWLIRNACVLVDRKSKESRKKSFELDDEYSSGDLIYPDLSGRNKK